MLKLTSVALLAVLSLSPPPSQSSEIEALKREVAALKAQQAAMQRDLQAIMTLLQGLAQPRQQQAPGAPEVPGLIGSSIPLAGEPTMGSQSARVTVVEISDYHCPFCRRSAQQTFPQIVSEYVKSGKAQYAFIDYPIAQLHPDAFRSHEAAACAGDQGKFWEMHTTLWAGAPVRDVDGLKAKAASVGVEAAAFTACMSSGKHAASIKESIARMERLGIGGTPMTLVGLTPGPGQPMTVVKYIYGAMPYSEFKSAIDQVLAQAR
jgi:protein-disulfide isomerase